MNLLRAALAAAALVLGAHAPITSAAPLSLNDAFARVIDHHPELQRLQFALDTQAAEAERAAQRPALRLGASVENALGSGAAHGLDGAELSLSLASLFERGGKRAARIEFAELQRSGIDWQRQTLQLDLLAEVARRYLDAVAAAEQQALAQEDLRQREAALKAIEQRVRAGSTPQSAQRVAEAARIRAEGEVAAAARQQQRALRSLSALWGAALEPIELATRDLSVLPPVPDLASLQTLLQRSPALRRFADEARLREARLQLARSSGVADVEWQFGLRRLQAERDWGLIGSVSIPFGSAGRAAPSIRGAESELAALALERETTARGLESTLVEVWSALDAAVDAAGRIERDLLPALAQAEQAVERAYRAGAVGHLDWLQIQAEQLDARQQRLQQRLAAHRALIELQRLTGEALVDPTRALAPTSAETTP